jgi:hypothetical protein
LNNKVNSIDERKEILLKYTVIILSFLTLIFGIFNLYRNEKIIYILELSFFALSLVLSYFVIKRKFIKQNIIIVLISTYFFTLFSFPQTKYHFSLFIWSMLSVGLTFYFINKKYARIIVSIYLLIIITIFTRIYLKSNLIPLPAFLNILFFILSFTLFIYYYEITREEAEKKLLEEIRLRKKTEEENKKLIIELKESILEIKQLSSFLPICSSCKSIRDDDGYWQQIEHYISEHSDTQFSHSLCPICANKLYPEFSDNENDDK